MTKETEPKKLGRPPQPVPQDKADDIIEWISEGKTLRDWCRIEGNVSFRAVYDWIEKDANFASRFARAREVGGHAIANECLAIIDEMPPPSATGGTDAGHVQWQKARVETRLKLLAKWFPKQYGDRIQQEVSGPNGGPVESVLNVSGLPTEVLVAIVAAKDASNQS